MQVDEEAVLVQQEILKFRVHPVPTDALAEIRRSVCDGHDNAVSIRHLAHRKPVAVRTAIRQDAEVDAETAKELPGETGVIRRCRFAQRGSASGKFNDGARGTFRTRGFLAPGDCDHE